MATQRRDSKKALTITLSPKDYDRLCILWKQWKKVDPEGYPTLEAFAREALSRSVWDTATDEEMEEII